MTPAPLQLGQAPSELALNSAGFTPLEVANALRIGSSSPVYVAGLLCTGIKSWLSATCSAGDCVSVVVALLIASPSVRRGRLRGLRRLRPRSWTRRGCGPAPAEPRERGSALIGPEAARGRWAVTLALARLAEVPHSASWLNRIEAQRDWLRAASAS